MPVLQRHSDSLHMDMSITVRLPFAVSVERQGRGVLHSHIPFVYVTADPSPTTPMEAASPSPTTAYDRSGGTYEKNHN